MVLITFLKENDKFKSLSITGHSQFDDIGSDIVCAGISAIAFGALNGFNELAEENFDIKVSDNLIEVEALNDACINDKLFSFTYYQFNTVFVQYPNYINIKVREV
ncbi:MAG: ribosomal-processing cysteine protease Prp [Erysipelothrix sp.]|nr:ribosomal-processing cysteine protease Prp [Erysipelothrix sp.]